MGCTKLQFISLQGNPVTEEPELLSCLTSVLPSLALVDGQELQQHTSRKVWVISFPGISCFIPILLLYKAV